MIASSPNRAIILPRAMILPVVLTHVIENKRLAMEACVPD
jgi:hypothetical protein